MIVKNWKHLNVLWKDKEQMRLIHRAQYHITAKVQEFTLCALTWVNFVYGTKIAQHNSMIA